MRVFHLVKGLGRGGAEILLVRTARTVDRRRRNGYGYFLPWKDALVPELKAQGCSVRCFPARNPLEMLGQLPKLVGHLKSWQPDVIHCHLPLAGVLGRLAGKILRVPVVYTEHNLQERYHPLTRVANRLTWTQQAKVIAVSEEVKDSIRRWLPEPPPVETVLNGVDCEQFRPRRRNGSGVREQLQLPSNSTVIGTIAAFRKQKRLDLWLEAAAAVAAEHPEVHFLMVGDGPEKPTVLEFVDRYDLRSRVSLPGLQSNIMPYLEAMDVFFMSSDFEGLPVAMLEAMASGIPVVATTAGGITEVIDDDNVGLTADPGDVPCLVKHLKSLLGDPKSAQRMGREGRLRIERAFSLERMQAQLEEIYFQATGSQVRKQRPFDYDVEDGVSTGDALELIVTALGPGSERTPRIPRFFDWKHREGPSGPSFLFGARSHEGQLVGLRAFQRWSVATPQGGQLQAVRAVDTSTHPAHQRRGIFTGLTGKGLEILKSRGVDFVFNTPNSQSRSGYLKMGWELVAEIPIWVKPNSPGKFTARERGHSLDQIVETHGTESLEQLLGETRPQATLHIPKNVEYLRWRYKQHPAVEYSFRHTANGSGLDALLITCVSARGRWRELAICELFARSLPAGVALLREALSESGCHYAMSCSHNCWPTSQALSALGFRVVPFRRVALTSLPLSEAGVAAVHSENWTLTTGDLQVF